MDSGADRTVAGAAVAGRTGSAAADRIGAGAAAAVAHTAAVAVARTAVAGCTVAVAAVHTAVAAARIAVAAVHIDFEVVAASCTDRGILYRQYIAARNWCKLPLYSSSS